MLLHFLFLTTAAAEMSPKIVGGGEADIEDWPFIVFIAIIGTEAAATCGGSLISAQTVLTAAHCLDDVTDNKQNFNEFKYTILMGHQKFQHSKMVRSVSDYETHHNYDPSATACDIGIMFLSKPVQFSTTVKKVLLMKKLSYKKDKLMQVAGWGAWKVDFPSNSLTLKSLAQTLLPAKKCDKFTDMGDLPAEGVICAGEVNATEFAYSGDSGGPLVRAGSQVQMGIVSYRAENYGITVYTSVPHYYKWIEDTQKRLYMAHCVEKAKRHSHGHHVVLKLASKTKVGGVTFSDYEEK
ncbi:granzyme H-like [Choristoneura fumiferana]|uniref:granzyme H-like n=1 Tax=Choristoneura fumiferana TaxID=7141 RepID=UPI003D1552A9